MDDGDSNFTGAYTVYLNSFRSGIIRFLRE